MICVTPAATPVTTPVEEPTVAIDPLPLLHVPPAVASVRLDVEPAHASVVPEIPTGNGLTVIGVVVIQPVPIVYVIVALPVATPVTTPPVLTIAVAISLLLHAPPAVASVTLVVKPRHTFPLPVIAAGNGLMVTGVVA